MIDETIEQPETKIEKWTRECLAQGFKFISKSLEKNGYSIAECNVCGHIDSYSTCNIRKGKVRCSKCLEAKYSSECLAQGFKYIGKSSEDSDYAIAECQTCCHADSYRRDRMRKGKVSCTNCLITKYSSECLAQGFKYIGKSSEDSDYAIAECQTCGHIDNYAKSNLREGRVRCELCLLNKYKAVAKPGWEYVDKTRIKKQSYVILKHSCSDNLVTVQIGTFLKGSYDCPHCMHSHFDERSNFYVIKVTHNNMQLIKIGVANNTDIRFGQYGLPDDATLEIIHVKPFTTKRLAIKFESMAKQALQDFKISEETAKSIFKDSGHTEAFTSDSIQTINQII